MTKFMATMWVMCLAGFLLLATDVFSEPFPSRQFVEEAREPTMVEWLRHVRRTLHKFPKLKWEEEQTSALIQQELDIRVPRCKAWLDIRVPCCKVWRRCNLGNSEAPVVALRADMEAFPIQDRGNIRASDPGKCMPLAMICMSPCHIGEAKLLHRHRHLQEGIVRLLFQPGEEGNARAEVMISVGRCVANLRCPCWTCLRAWSWKSGPIKLELRSPRRAHSRLQHLNFNFQLVGEGRELQVDAWFGTQKTTAAICTAISTPPSAT